MKVLELFAGVGGYHIALKSQFPGLRLDVQPYDNNQTAVQTYELNLGREVNRTNIEHLQRSDVDGFDMWAMSPPCQPHTQTTMSLQQDAADQRSTPFKHVCNLLESVAHPPEHIICENVPGFIASDQFNQFRSALSRLDYDWQVFLVTPQLLNVPNSRLRVFVLASKQGSKWKRLPLPRLYRHIILAMPDVCVKLGPQVLLDRELAVPIPDSVREQCVQLQDLYPKGAVVGPGTGDLWETAMSLEHVLGEEWRTVENASACTAQEGTCTQCVTAKRFLPDLLDMHRALKVHRVLDVVTTASKRTNCFTKGYRKNLFGTGSVIASTFFASHFCEASHEGRLVISDAGKQKLLQLSDVDLPPCKQVMTHLRWFKSQDLAKLHGYPEWFLFPANLAERQRCALLGNGLSLHCVQGLLRHLLSNVKV